MAGQESRRMLVGTRLVEEPGGFDERTVPYTDLEVRRLVEAARQMVRFDRSALAPIYYDAVIAALAPFPQWSQS